MNGLRKEYIVLFNGVSEVINEMESLVQRLKLLQQAAENCYLDSGEVLFINKKTEDEEEERTSLEKPQAESVG